MKTIAENLQILKDSTDAIKQAIIDKGGDVSGDISTWANSINNMNVQEEITFVVTQYTLNASVITLTGNLLSVPSNVDLDTRYYLSLIGRSTGGFLISEGTFLSNNKLTDITINIDMQEPVLDYELFDSIGLLLIKLQGMQMYNVKLIKA